MGDRCSATLTVAGIISSPADWEAFAQALKDSYAEGAKRLTSPKDGAGISKTFQFYEVNYGQMPPELEEVLERLSLSYLWSHSSGEDYGPGLIIGQATPDGMTIDTVEITHQGEFCVPLSQVGNTAHIAQLHALEIVQDAIPKAPFLYASSAHALLAAFAGDGAKLAAWRAMRDAQAN